MTLNIKIIERKIKDKIWSYVKDGFYPYRIKDSPLVKNINFDYLVNQKRALVCYSPHYYFQSIDIQNIGRTIPFEIFKLIKILSEFGFCIDIISVNDIRSLDFVRSNDYALIFGFGETFYKMTHLQPNAQSIFYVTENHPEFSFREETKRLDYFYERHLRKASMERSGRFYKPEHVTVKYDHVIILGEEEQFAGQYEKPYSIFPTGFLNAKFANNPKDHNVARKHFLWLGSSAVIHKGLDLLIDIFRERDDITLHICGLNAKSRRLLEVPQKKNIIDYGFVNINSEIFLKIVDTCSFSILPSCSEGMATSITTSMFHGLIPIVMKDAGFNRLGNNAIFLASFKIDYIDDTLSQLAEYDMTDLEIFSKKVLAFASRNFSTAAYEERLRAILTETIK